MSLILEALQKLERERPDEARHTTVLLAPLVWPVARRSRWLGIAVSALLIAALSSAGWFLVWSMRQVSTQPAQAARVLPRTATATPAPSVTPVRAPSASSRPARPSPAVARPAAPAAHQPAAPSDVFRLTAIGDQDGVSVAMINDRLVRVGDSLLGARVVGIGEIEVEMENEADGRHFTVGF